MASHVSSSTVLVQVWNKDSDPKQQWIDGPFTQGSSIVIAHSSTKSYWTFEKHKIGLLTYWSFRADPDENLYITFDASGNLTMQPKGMNSKFVVLLTKPETYIIREARPTKRYIAVSNGELILSNTPAEWSFYLQKQEGVHDDRSDLVNIRDQSSGAMWINDDPDITVEQDPGSADKTVWTVDPQDSYFTEWHISSKYDDKFITTDVTNSSVQLAEATDGNIDARLVARTPPLGYPKNDVFMQDKYKTRYFTTEMVGSTSLLVLTHDDDQAHATIWEIPLTGFEIGGKFYPPIYGCAEKLEAKVRKKFHQRKSKM